MALMLCRAPAEKAKKSPAAPKRSPAESKKSPAKPRAKKAKPEPLAPDVEAAVAAVDATADALPPAVHTVTADAVDQWQQRGNDPGASNPGSKARSPSCGSRCYQRSGPKPRVHLLARGVNIAGGGAP